VRKTAKHTPGSWVITQKYDDDRGVICVEHPTFDAIDIVTDRWADSFEEHQANARLVVAGPGLLEAARDALRTLSDAYEITSDRRQSIRLLKAAIAKAESK